MTEQTKAQRLADLLIDDADCMEDEIKRNPMLFGGSADCSLPGMQKAAAELHRLDALNADLIATLEKLARLGNGDHYGNSLGNEIAIDALIRARRQEND